MTKASNPGEIDGNDRPLILHLGHEELVIRQRYETISIVNDLLIGAWFLVGSFLFFSPSTTYAATWLFVIGSVEMLIRPAIRFTRRVHLRRYHPGMPGIGDGGHDF
ncbi:MAG: YrhK family protein [Micrococcaceae bacterium]|nr:YrhK family protein [Micrococcaceae bacterium]